MRWVSIKDIVIDGQTSYWFDEHRRILMFDWLTEVRHVITHIDGFVQDCSNSIANALELLQSCTKPSM